VIASVVVACGLSDRATFVTFDYQNNRRNNRLDLHVSRLLAKRFGLNHQIVPVEPCDEEICRDYQLRTGFCGGWGKAADFYQACMQRLDTTANWLTGFAGELGRAFYWKREQSDCLASETLLDRIGLPKEPSFVEAVRDWLASVPARGVPGILDLAYLEFRVGCWASPHLYGAAPFPVNVMPFNHRRIFEVMLTMPIEYRRHARLADDLIAANCPDMLKFPFNDWRGWRKWRERLSWKLASGIRLLKQ
jgi:hypothetical protein